MKKRLVMFGAALVTSTVLSSVAFAGQWQSDSIDWWWQNDDGSYPVNQWQWIDGNQDGISECYYFGIDGYMFANTTTPDGYIVNSDGAWILSGIVQSQQNIQNQIETTYVTVYRSNHNEDDYDYTDYDYDYYDDYEDSNKNETVFDENNIGKSLLDAGVNIISIVANITTILGADNPIAKAVFDLFQ